MPVTSRHVQREEVHRPSQTLASSAMDRGGLRLETEARDVLAAASTNIVEGAGLRCDFSLRTPGPHGAVLRPGCGAASAAEAETGAARPACFSFAAKEA